MVIGIFFWKNNTDPDNDESSIPLISRDKICRPKCKGGLGIRKAQDINAVLLAKLGLKVLANPDHFLLKLFLQNTLRKIIFLK